MTTPSDDATEEHRTTPSTPVSAGENRDTVAAGGATVPGEQLPRGHAQTQPIDPDGSPAAVDEDSHLTADTEGDDVDAVHGSWGAAPGEDPRGRDRGQRPAR